MKNHLRIIRAIFKKEARDLFRNKSALLVTFLVVPLTIPAIFIFFGLVFYISQPSHSTADIAEVLAVNAPRNAELNRELLSRDIRLVDASRHANETLLDGSSEEVGEALFDMSMERKNSFGDSLPRSVAAGYALIFPPDFDALMAEDSPVRVDLFFDSSNNDFTPLLKGLRESFSTIIDRQVDEQLNLVGLERENLSGLKTNEVNLVTPQATRVQILGGMIALMFVLALELGRGQTYNAYWGERQKKTMEALLLAPVAGIPIALGKMALVMSIAVVVSALILAAFFGIINAIVSMGERFGDILPGTSMLTHGFNLGEYFYALGLLWPAVLLGVIISHYLCVAAKTERSAQSLMSIASFSFFAINGMVLFSPVTDLASLAGVPLVSQITMMHLHLRGEEISLGLYMTSMASALIASIIMMWLVGREYVALSRGRRPLEA
jgi:ABC-type Na+ efflux pump permease subunit